MLTWHNEAYMQVQMRKQHSNINSQHTGHMPHINKWAQHAMCKAMQQVIASTQHNMTR